MQSPAAVLVESLVRRLGRGEAHKAIDGLFASMPVVELAALELDWSFWARPNQIPPETRWRSWFHLCGRGNGKTKAISKWINGEVKAGRVGLICLIAQDEQSAIDIQVTGPSGLIATAPPENKPLWLAGSLQLVWPNGARAYVRTPEAPGKIRGLEYHLSWGSELQSWPPGLRDEAFSNVELSTRLGQPRIVLDSTPKRGHPILKALIARAEQYPEEHLLARGTTHDNYLNLGEGYIEELQRKYEGTRKGREELLGEMLEDSENAVIRQAWVDAARRHYPDKFVRRVIGVDPSTTVGGDKTGIVEVGSGVDGQAYVTVDRSGRHSPSVWADIVLDLYVADKCDCVVVEKNKAGDFVASTLRAQASTKGLNVVVVGTDAITRAVPGTVYVKEVYARGPKEDRAQPVATAYERGRVSHVIGADLADLEELITTWEPEKGQRSPDALDALVHAVVELLGLLSNKPGGRSGFQGLSEINRSLSRPSGGFPSLLNPIGDGRNNRL